MVPMSVREDKMILIPAFFGQLITEPANAGPGINDDDVVAFCADLYAGGVTTVYMPGLIKRFSLRFLKNVPFCLSPKAVKVFQKSQLLTIADSSTKSIPDPVLIPCFYNLGRRPGEPISDISCLSA